MPDPTYIACPRCGEPYAMTSMQKRLYHGRTLTCQRCAKPFTITEETPEPVPAPEVRPWGVSSARATGEVPPAEATAPAPVKPSADDDRGGGLTAGRMAVVIGAVAVVIGLLLYLAVSPSIHRSREIARRATCASNLTQLGVALQFYANSNRGRFPDSLAVLVADGSLPAELLVCPSSKHTPAPGDTAAKQVANLAAGQHQSYVYVGKGVTAGRGRQVIVYEPLEHHDGAGANILYTDGSTAFLAKADALAALPQLASGNPLPTSQPASTQPATAP
jgi:prepilin-type processing-associated H-X9-DG protein